MASDFFDSTTNGALLHFFVDHPNNRRISLAEKEKVIGWLTNAAPASSSQEFSRRNYTRKTFTWEKDTQQLFTTAKNKDGHARLVVTWDEIVKTVRSIHQNNGHAGWEAHGGMSKHPTTAFCEPMSSSSSSDAESVHTTLRSVRKGNPPSRPIRSSIATLPAVS